MQSLVKCAGEVNLCLINVQVKSKRDLQEPEPALGIKPPRAGRAVFWNATTDGAHTAARRS